MWKSQTQESFMCTESINCLSVPWQSVNQTLHDTEEDLLVQKYKFMKSYGVKIKHSIILREILL